MVTRTELDKGTVNRKPEGVPPAESEIGTGASPKSIDYSQYSGQFVALDADCNAVIAHANSPAELAEMLDVFSVRGIPFVVGGFVPDAKVSNL